MSRTPLIAGNWKMNTLLAEAVGLARALRDRVDHVNAVEKLVCPPYPYLHPVRDALAGSTISVGAQNLHWEEKGAFTGEVSVTQVAEVCSYVIIGHSERRQLFGETDETVNLRLRAALAHGLKPIMCVGETLAEREAGSTADILVRQTRAGLDGLKVGVDFVVAYEPIWAIGTGLAADGATAQDAIGLIRRTVREAAPDHADGIRILYGGSVTPDNIAEFMAEPDIDGGLVGGASLKADVFAAIIETTAAGLMAGTH